MTRFCLRAAYAAVIMAAMSISGHAADYTSSGSITVADFDVDHLIEGDNISIKFNSETDSIYNPVVNVLGSNSTPVPQYSLKTAKDGLISIVGAFDGVQVASGALLNMGSDDTYGVEITASETVALSGKKAVASLLSAQNKGEVNVKAKNINIHGTLNKSNSGDEATSIYGLKVNGSSAGQTGVATIGDATTDSLVIDVKSDGEAIGVIATGDALANIDAKNIQIIASTSAIRNTSSFYADFAGEVNVGSEVTDHLKLEAGTKYAVFNEKKRDCDC